MDRAIANRATRRDHPVLWSLYGDAVLVGCRAVGRRLVFQGLGEEDARIPLSPRLIEELLTTIRCDNHQARRRGMARFTTRTAGESIRYIELTAQVRGGLARLLETCTGCTPSEDDTDRIMAAAVAGDIRELAAIIARGMRRGVAPPPEDEGVTGELQDMRKRVVTDWRRALDEELTDASADASDRAKLEAIDRLRAPAG